MRTHQDTLLAMKLSSVLLSLCAAILVVLLLTGSALSDLNARTFKPLPVVTAPPLPSVNASVPVVNKTIYIYVVTATPAPQAIVSKPVPVAVKPVLVNPVTRAAVAASSARSDLPVMPQLAAVPDMPKVQAPAPRGGGGGGGGGGGNNHAASAPRSQPPFVTKTS
jgi:hypothetical protein